MRRAVMVSRLFYLVDGKRVDSLFVMKNLPGMDLEASPAPSEVIHQTREVHKIDLGLGGYNKGWFLFILFMFKVLCATVWL